MKNLRFLTTQGCVIKILELKVFYHSENLTKKIHIDIINGQDWYERVIMVIEKVEKILNFVNFFSGCKKSQKIDKFQRAVDVEGAGRLETTSRLLHAKVFPQPTYCLLFYFAPIYVMIFFVVYLLL